MSKQYLRIDVDVEIEGSADSSAELGEEGLYGHSEAVASFAVRFELVPVGPTRYWGGGLRPSNDPQPSVELKGCSVFWANQDGDDSFEREYELSEVQYAEALAKAVQSAKATRFNVTIEKVA